MSAADVKWARDNRNEKNYIDSYVNEENKKIQSSFKMHKALDVPMIRKQKEWASRLDVLKETINKWLINTDFAPHVKQ